MVPKEIKKYERTLEHLVSSGLLEPAIKADALIRRLNSTPITEQEEIQNIIKELFGSEGANPSVSTGFHCDFGCNIHVGDNFYTAYNCVMLDYAEIRIGDNCLIGPNVAKRSYDGTEDYRFDVKSQTPDGREASSTIYVVVSQGGTPEFTQVVR